MCGREALEGRRGMTMQDETSRIAEAFFAAWTSGKEREARALLADDLEYSGPLNTYRSADALLPPLMTFAALLRGARIVESVADGDRAALLYDCELPSPVGTLRTASFMRIDKGRIRTILHAFDATELRKLQGRKSGDA
jgi:hypothetical protein